MALDDLQKHFQRGTLKKVRLEINDNRSTMLSVRWNPDETRVSLHRLFLDAPRNIMEELACYVQEEKGPIPQRVRAYIDSQFKHFDYSHELDLSKLHIQGNVYNLKSIYQNLNEQYFDDELKLHITWFGKAQPKTRNRLTFGLYHDPLKLIKINRLLDSPSFPDYFVSFVIYHEMVHHVCPSYYDERGIHRIHTREFKAKEKQFEHFDLAQEWIKSHKEFLFHID
jgi:hypothetical protein